MKKIAALILLFAMSITFVSCSGNDGTPDGMQLVRGGEKIGYYMYAPEEWTVANLGEIATAYASNVDSSSISYVELPMPETTVDEYFRNGLLEFPVMPAVIENECGKTTFGNADEAYKYVFEHEYSGHKFRTMQIFTKYKDRFGIFTFNSMLENISSSEVYQYDFYSEKINSVIVNFKFVDKSGKDVIPSYEKDADGYMLVSDKSVAKYSLYLPETFTVDYSSGITSAHLDDGSSITLSSATATGVYVSEYWEARKAELETIAKNVTEIKINEPSALGNSKRAYSYEYTFVYNNTTYHVYQVLAVTTFNGFVFTYTATEENYSKHIEEILKIAEKVEL